MVAHDVVFDAHLHVAAGDGRLVRSIGACLYVPSPIDAAARELIAHVVSTAGDLLAAVGDFVLEHTEAPPFVLVTWPTAATSDEIHLLVRGDASVETDMASVPALSGAGTTTWAEHRVRRQPEQASIRSGAPTENDTVLAGGVVPAGGFSLRLTANAGATSAPAPAPAPAEMTPATNAATEPPAESDDAVTAAADPESSGGQHGGLGGLAALRAASGASAPETPAAIPALNPETRPEPSPPTPTPAAAPPASPAPPSPPPPTAPTAPTALLRSKPESADVAEAAPPGPPQFPGAIGDNGDPEVTLAPGDLSDDPLPPVHRLLQAAVCENGHSNPPHRSACRICDAPLTTDHTTTVEQPVLAIAALPSGDLVPIDSTIVIGRNPSAQAARVDAEHQLVVLDAPSSVSRTHLVISVDGWTVTATDCGSQGGSALVPDGAEEPIELTAWVPHELNGGDTLYLGGPTFVRILDVPN